MKKIMPIDIIIMGIIWPVAVIAFITGVVVVTIKLIRERGTQQ